MCTDINTYTPPVLERIETEDQARRLILDSEHVWGAVFKTYTLAYLVKGRMEFVHDHTWDIYKVTEDYVDGALLRFTRGDYILLDHEPNSGTPPGEYCVPWFKE